MVASLAYFLLSYWPDVTSIEALRDFVVQALTGKAYFHLYFTIVLIQASVLVPMLVWLLKGRVIDWRYALLAAMGLQWVAFQLQREVFQVARPGSFIFWYMVPLFLGIAVGTDQGLRDRLKVRSASLLWTAIFLGLAYSWASIVHLYGWSASSDMINGLYSAYTGILAITLWVACDQYPKGFIRTFLSRLGRISLPLFLLHPAIMFLFGGPTLTTAIAAAPASGLIYWAGVLTVSYLCAIFALRLKFVRLILGESTRKVTTDSA